MQPLLLFLLLALLSQPLRAQPAIVGRVTDYASKQGVPGARVLQKGTANSTVTAEDGCFSVKPLPANSTGLVLIFASIGYLSVERVLKTADSVRVVLTAGADCNVTPAATIELVSGLYHTPFGGRLQVYGTRLALPLRATASYQTNFRSTTQQHWQLEWLGLIRTNLGRFDVGLRRQAVHQAQQPLHFTSHSLTVEADWYRGWPVLLSVGYARLIGERGSRAGFGGELGAWHVFQGPQLALQATASRWPGYWQWQGEIRRPFHHLTAGLRLHAVARYAELSTVLSYTLY